MEFMLLTRIEDKFRSTFWLMEATRNRRQDILQCLRPAEGVCEVMGVLFLQVGADLTGFARAITYCEPASVGLSAAELLSSELLYVIEVGDTQRSKHTMSMKLLPVVEADTNKDFFAKEKGRRYLFCANVECNVKCKPLLI
jgi:hypothetical protein